MGKLLIGQYGSPPDAESAVISLRDCHQRLGLKPTDFVSSESPVFFRKKQGAMGKYLVFQLDEGESKDAAVWRSGYYLLPLEAADVLKVFNKEDLARGGAVRRPYQVQAKQDPPSDVMERASRWADQSQPLLFDCHCSELILRMDAPHLLRRHWKLKLGCAKRCMPALKGEV